MIKAVARVRLVIDVPCGGTWDLDCDFAQVRKHAIDEAIRSIRGEFTSQHERLGWTIQANPNVTAILISETDDANGS